MLYPIVQVLNRKLPLTLSPVYLVLGASASFDWSGAGMFPNKALLNLNRLDLPLLLNLNVYLFTVNTNLVKIRNTIYPVQAVPCRPCILHLRHRQF